MYKRQSWDKERIAQIQLPDPADDDPHPRLLLEGRGIHAGQGFTALRGSRQAPAAGTYRRRGLREMGIRDRFYREIFPEGSCERKGHFEDRKGNGSAVTVTKGEVDRATVIALQIEGDGKATFSYTHLDVYKRQVKRNAVPSLTSWTS